MAAEWTGRREWDISIAFPNVHDQLTVPVNSSLVAHQLIDFVPGYLETLIAKLAGRRQICIARTLVGRIATIPRSLAAAMLYPLS